MQMHPIFIDSQRSVIWFIHPHLLIRKSVATPRFAWMVKLLSSGALLASLCRAAAVANSPCLVTTVSQQQSCPALLVVRMVHSKCRGETYKYGKDEVKRRNDWEIILKPNCRLFFLFLFSPSPLSLFLLCLLPLLVFFHFLPSSFPCLLFVLVFFVFVFLLLSSSSSHCLPRLLPLLFFLVTTFDNTGCKVASPWGKSPMVSGVAWLCPPGLHCTLCAGGRLAPKRKSCTDSTFTFRKSGLTQSLGTTFHRSGTLWTIP